MQKRLLIVGGSYAACELAAQARESGYAEDILIVSDEQDLPYHRPPLSKSFLKDVNEELMPLRAEAFYRDKKIDVELGTRVVSIDGNSNRARLSNDVVVTFDTLALATGARARVLPGLEACPSNVHYVRNVADARNLRSTIQTAERVVIIGAGFIGLEVASALARQGKKVTVVEAADRVLARAVSPVLSKLLTEIHLDNGVTLLTSRMVRPIVGPTGLVNRIEVDDGSVLSADLVVVGVGSEANLDLARQLELDVRNGIVVNNRSRTSRDNVYAAGDCATFNGPFNPTGIRLESVQNAMDQARVAGDAIAGGNKVYNAVPWFWSDQYEFKVQIAGLSGAGTDWVSRPGDKSDVSVFHFRDGICVCVESVNRPRDHMAARRLLASNKQITLTSLQAVDFNLPELLKT
ncbi:FAD-dependent oxidoreductase [Caballeronia sp. EK]|uniref:NAD(P)/FAD-dependent oxidoreductase n=1 Tax=Caballeronia sp. EK TaxID=2767469 RepID=UPI001655AF57|nr:FAD-dependent oxidoreductase [Caballeronia sp. EK]MBC8641648.1 FAD-dependent oxidoreductase [Caballeronia sp. EK]